MKPLPLIITVSVILVNAFFAMAEYSLVRIRPSLVEALVRRGNRMARLIRFANQRIGSYLSAVQLAITMTSLALGWVGEPEIARILRSLFPLLPFMVQEGLAVSLSFILAFVIITSVHITFGELVPKLIALRSPERTALLTILPLTAMYIISYIPMLLLNQIASAAVRLIGLRKHAETEIHSEEEIKILLEQQEEAGTLSLQRLVMFENLFDFGRSTVREVMTPRGSIAFLSLRRSWEENLQDMLQRKASRYPVCTGDLDTVSGYVHVKDLAFTAMTETDRFPDLLGLIRPIMRIPESMSLAECLKRFQERQVGLAVVLDRQEKVSGLLSMEDVVEEIVGEIRDEFEHTPRVLLTDAIVAEATELLCRDRDLLALIRGAVRRLHSARPVFDEASAADLVYRRESLLSSALGHGAAFPHARIDRLERPLLSFTRCPDGAPFKAPDGKPVVMVFLILTPFGEPTAQLGLLSKLAHLILNPFLSSRLQEAERPEELIEVLDTFEGTVPI